MTVLLSRRSAQALVNARLDTLGHDKDFMTEDAIEALRARAGYEASAFHAALGAVLFLAATEDAPRIERSHVEHAVPLEAPPTEARPAGANPVRPSRPWGRTFILTASAGGALLVAMLALWLTQGPPAAAPALVSPPPDIANSLPPPPAAPLPATMPEPTPEPPSVRTALPDTAAVSVSSPPSLSAAPPLRVSLVVPLGDHAAMSRFTALALVLRRAGLGDVQLQSINFAQSGSRPLRHHVVYFFRQDAALAKNVAAALDTAEHSAQTGYPWVPFLVPAAPGATSHPPGSIDVFSP